MFVDLCQGTLLGFTFNCKARSGCVVGRSGGAPPEWLCSGPKELQSDGNFHYLLVLWVGEWVADFSGHRMALAPFGAQLAGVIPCAESLANHEQVPWRCLRGWWLGFRWDCLRHADLWVGKICICLYRPVYAFNNVGHLNICMSTNIPNCTVEEN